MANFESPNPVIPFADSPFYIPQTLEPWQSDGGPASRVSAHLGWVARTRMRCSRSRRSVRPAIPYRTTASCLFRPEQRALSKRRQRASPTGSRVTPRRHSPTSPSRFRSAGVASLIAGSWSVVPSRRASPHSASPWRSQSSRIDEACERTIAFMFPGQGAQYVGWHAAYTNGNLSSAIASIAVRLCSRTSSVATSARFSSRRPRTHTSRRNESLPKLGGRSPASSQLRWRLQSCSRPGASSPPHVSATALASLPPRAWPASSHSKTG